jgi:hypothetical protein
MSLPTRPGQPAATLEQLFLRHHGEELTDNGVPVGTEPGGRASG